MGKTTNDVRNDNNAKSMKNKIIMQKIIPKVTIIMPK